MTETQDDTASNPIEESSSGRSLLRRLYRNQVDIDWRSAWRKGLTGSGVIVAICLGALLLRGLNLGIEFEGGAIWEAEAEGIDAGDVRDAMADIGFGGAIIQTGGGVVQVRAEVDAAEGAQSTTVATALAEVTGTDANDVVINDISASWGDEVTDKALRALVVFLIAIAIYLTVRLEWRMAVGALVALVHDIVLTVGIYAVFQFQVTSATVIAFLTILGYSLYDTLVVFDRVRENEARPSLAGKVPFADIMGLSSNQVFMRSVNTTITSVLPIVSVLLIGSFGFGAITLREFAIALLVGMLSGTYSSLFIAGPIVAWLKSRESRYADLVGTEGADRAALSEMAASSAPSTRPKRATRSKPEDRRISKGTARRQTGGGSTGAIPARPRKQKRRG